MGHRERRSSGCGCPAPASPVALSGAPDNDDDSPIQAEPTLPDHAAEAFNKIAAAMRDGDGSKSPGEASALRRMLAAARQVAGPSTPAGEGDVACFLTDFEFVTDQGVH